MPAAEAVSAPDTFPAVFQDRLAMVCELDISTANYPILTDHRLNGIPVVPLALMTEWLAHAALHENPGLLFQGLDDIRVLNGIKLQASRQPVQLVAGKARKVDADYKIEVAIRGLRSSSASAIHCRATAVLSEDPPPAPSADSVIRRDTPAYPRTVGDVYQDILFQGPGLQGLEKILGYCEQGLVATVKSAPAPREWIDRPFRSDWIADPLILDAAFQMAIVWCFEQQGKVCLPGFAASYRQYRTAFPKTGVTAVMTVTDSTPRRLRADFTFLDEREQVVARMGGYEATVDGSLFEAFRVREAAA